ncbi:MAG: oligogalacturonate lyase family protein [Bacteroidales bacterium]|nr:oligogalacturonate lyase family protein [Bacteroidales bacterium]
MKHIILKHSLTTLLIVIYLTTAPAQIGKRFPSERKVIKDPVTGTELTFLTSTPAGDSKIYQTHNQWTSDGNWVIFRSNRSRGEAMAVNEKTGVIVQVSEGGYTGMLNVARKSMKLYFMRDTTTRRRFTPLAGQQPGAAAPGTGTQQRPQQAGPRVSPAIQVIEVDLEKLFADSENGKLRPAAEYQKICGYTPPELGAGGDMALDANEDVVYFRIGREAAIKHIPEGTKIETNFGPRNMGAGPSGIGKMDLKTGKCSVVTAVPFQVGHIQTNPWVPGEIVFCWETGGKAPQRTWTVMADGSGLRPLYPESEYEWVTHEAVITKDEVAIAIMGHRKVGTPQQPANPQNPGQEVDWGPSGTREKPTGLGIVNLRTREMTIAGQTESGSGLWHVNGSYDGRFAVGDDFSRGIYLIDRKTREMILLSTGHKATASDHPHPTFSNDGTRIEIQSAMLSEDNRSMNICIIPVPEEWLKRK